MEAWGGLDLDWFSVSKLGEVGGLLVRRRGRMMGRLRFADKIDYVERAMLFPATDLAIPDDLNLLFLTEP